MMLHSPEIGAWYRQRYSSASFEVVALDETHGTIEIQYTDGDLGELDLAEWEIGRFIDMPPPDDALSILGMDQDPEEGWDDGMLSEDPLFDASDRYDWADNTDFENITSSID